MQRSLNQGGVKGATTRGRRKQTHISPAEVDGERSGDHRLFGDELQIDDSQSIIGEGLPRIINKRTEELVTYLVDKRLKVNRGSQVYSFAWYSEQHTPKVSAPFSVDLTLISL